MRRSAANLVALLALVAIPAAASAQQAPPPDSELDQYVPTYPDAKQDKELGGGGGGNGGGGDKNGGSGGGGATSEADPVPPATVEELNSLGPAGEAAAEFAQGNSAGDGSAGNGNGGNAGGGGEAPSSVSAIGGALAGDSSGDGGMGVLLPLLLGAIAVAGILYALRRRGILGSSGRE